MNDCFLRDDGQPRSTFCDRLEYNGGFGLISDLNASFENLDSETVAGLDYNVSFRKELEIADEPMTFRLNVRANQLKERSVTFIGDDLLPQQDDFAGQFGFPEWTGTAFASLSVSDYRFVWSSRYIGDVEQDPLDVDEFSDAIDSEGTGFFADTCGGPEFGDVRCRDVGFADSYFEHTASIAYIGDTMTIRAGIENILDTTPPLVDGNEVFSISNVPIGNGYDLDGREFFLIVTKDF